LLSQFDNMGAYDAGQLFYVNAGGAMTALDAKSGKQNWAIQLPFQTSFDSKPVASNGLVYVNGGGEGGEVYGVDQRKGKLIWDTGEIDGGGHGSPSIGPGTVFEAFDCVFYAFDAASGQTKWRVKTNCIGGGGVASTYYKHKVYMQDDFGHYVFTAKTGKLKGT